MMEHDTTTDGIELGNRFTGPDVEEVEELSDEESVSQIYDDDDIEQENNDTESSSISEEDSDAEGFTEVKSSSEASKI